MNQIKDQNVQVLNTLLVMYNTVKTPMTFVKLWHLNKASFLLFQWMWFILSDILASITTCDTVSCISSRQHRFGSQHSQYIFTYLTGGWFFCLSWFELSFAKKPIFKIYSLLTCLVTHNPHFSKFVTILPCWNKSIL